MKVPKPVLIGLLFSAALFAGYQISQTLHEDAPATAAVPVPAAAVSAFEPGPQQPVIINLTMAAPAASSDPGTVLNVTLNGQSATAAAVPGSETVDAAQSRTAIGNAGNGGATTDQTWSAAVPAPVGSRSPSNSALSASSAPSAYSPPAARAIPGGVVQVPAPSQPAPAGSAAPAAGAAATTTGNPMGASPVIVDTGDRGDAAQDFSITAIGNNIVIAYGNSVAYVGNDGRLTANTGNASSSGTVALDVAGSSLATGTSGSTPTPSAITASGPATGPASSTDLDLNHGVPGRGLAISGYEDHSLNVGGRDHVVTYDDSNVFIARDGQINANTGDTDSSGLNVVDATGSVVHSGNENEDADEDDDGDDSDDSDAAAPVGGFVPAIIDHVTDVSAVPPTSDPSTSVPSATDASTSDSSDDADVDDPVGPPPAPADPPAAAPPRASAGVSDDDDEDAAGTTAAGDEAMVIGGDGFDDLGVDVSGEGHVVSYDDCNVVIGGQGDVNAQIGDSDTSGAVVMGVTNSVIGAGDST